MADRYFYLSPGDTDQEHPRLGRFRRGEQKQPVRLSDEVAEALRTGGWRVDPAPRLKGHRGPAQLSVESLSPDAEAYVSIPGGTLTVAWPGMENVETREVLPKTLVVPLGALVARSIREKVREATPELVEAVRALHRRYRRAWNEWAHAEGIELSYRAWHALPRGGRRPARGPRPEHQEAARARRLRGEGKRPRQIFATLHPGQKYTEVARKRLARMLAPAASTR